MRENKAFSSKNRKSSNNLNIWERALLDKRFTCPIMENEDF